MQSEFYLPAFRWAVSLAMHESCFVSLEYAPGDHDCAFAVCCGYHVGGRRAGFAALGGAGALDSVGILAGVYGIVGVSPYAPDVCLPGMQRRHLPVF